MNNYEHAGISCDNLSFFMRFLKSLIFKKKKEKKSCFYAIHVRRMIRFRSQSDLIFVTAQRSVRICVCVFIYVFTTLRRTYVVMYVTLYLYKYSLYYVTP